MKYWARSTIKPFIHEFGYYSICEIGASYGIVTDMIAGGEKVHVSIIDPCLDADLEEKYRTHNDVHVYKGISLDVLPIISGPFDCILIDGDHNWYTVYNELRIIHERKLLRHGGAIFFHDVSWPYGRRDMYYAPETIPDEFQHNHAKKGIIHGRSALVENGGENDDLFNAEVEGGARNGVLTAIEDFVREQSGRYDFFRFTDEAGLGIMIERSGQDWNNALLKWKLKCWLENIPASLKAFVRYKLPQQYLWMKRLRAGHVTR